MCSRVCLSILKDFNRFQAKKVFGDFFVPAQCTTATVVEKCGSNAQCSNHICTCNPGYVKQSVIENKPRCVDINECTLGQTNNSIYINIIHLI